jgi:DNA helicase-2/ATP-dependent DNA helicase PcrA
VARNAEGGGGFNDQFRSTYESPGWKRAQSASRPAAEGGRATPRLPDIEGRAFRAPDGDGRPLQRGKSPGDILASSDPAAAGGLSVGQRIFHQKFGYGRITEIDGAKLTVAFEKAGVKKVVESFVERTP